MHHLFQMKTSKLRIRFSLRLMQVLFNELHTLYHLYIHHIAKYSEDNFNII